MAAVVVLCTAILLIAIAIGGFLTMAQIDDLNAAVTQLTTDIATLTAKVDAIQPSAPVDLTGAISAVQSADAGVNAATATLNQKFPS